MALTWTDNMRSPGDAARQGLDVRIDGPDGPLPDADLRRLFPGSRLTGVRLDRIRACPRVIVSMGDAIVAVATCVKSEREMRVPDVGIDADCPGARCPRRDVLHALLDGIELSSLAAGCGRVVISPPDTSMASLERRGYVRVNERCAGGWIEKTLT